MWLVCVALLGGIVWLSLWPPPRPVEAIGISDRILHALAYAALALAWLLGVVWRPGRGPGPIPRGAPAVMAAAVGLGIALEIVQPAFGRSGDPLDALGDVVGVALGAAAWAGLRRAVRRRTGARAR